MIIWVPLIRDESLICRKEKGNVYDPHAVAIIRGNVLLDISPCFGNFYLYLTH